MRPSSVDELALLSIYPSRSDKTFSFGFHKAVLEYYGSSFTFLV
jgi:hypothetical protein